MIKWYAFVIARDSCISARRFNGELVGAHLTGFLESVYEEALALEFSAQGISFERQKVVPVSYRGQQVGEHRLDFYVAGIAVLELKAAKALEDVHFAIVRSYMKACSVEIGLLLNFAAMPLTIRRVSRERTFYQGETTELS